MFRDRFASLSFLPGGVNSARSSPYDAQHGVPVMGFVTPMPAFPAAAEAPDLRNAVLL